MQDFQLPLIGQNKSHGHMEPEEERVRGIILLYALKRKLKNQKYLVNLSMTKTIGTKGILGHVHI